MLAISRVSVISLALLRYLQVKGGSTGFLTIHHEMSFCTASEEWDVSDQSLRQILRTMTGNQLVLAQDCELDTYYSIAPAGYQLIKQFVDTDNRIVYKAWEA